MDSETLAAEIHGLKVDLTAIRNDLLELTREAKEIKEFADEFKKAVMEVAANPMLRGMGFNLGSLSEPGLRLPGMD